MKASFFVSLIGLLMFNEGLAHSTDDESKVIQVAAKNRYERTALVNLGLSIEGVYSDNVWGIAAPQTIESIKKTGFKILSAPEVSPFDFPPADSRFHNYAELELALRTLTGQNADIARLHSIGKSLEGRDLWAIQINTTPEALVQGQSNKPGIVFLGTHHAREHVSTEIPLMAAEYLLSHRNDANIAALIDSRDIWFIPMVNPDGVEWDVSTGRYKSWRKNRRTNRDGTRGVDLNRNYGYMWGTGGSSRDGYSDVYMGTAPFSEPETQAVRDFVTARSNFKVLLSFHTFSELILYPWGHTYDPIANEMDRSAYEAMATTMAQWNNYTPQQSSDLYIASGDTTDWSYGELGIFSFTFELSPRNYLGSPGFYPGQSVLDRVFRDNLQPILYLTTIADDPHQVVKGRSGHLKNYVEPNISPDLFLKRHPY